MTRQTSAQPDKARRIVRDEYGDSENFMAPNILRYLRYTMVTPSVAVEIAEGKGLDRQRIVGLSTVRQHPDGSTERLTDVSRVLQDPTDAEIEAELARIQQEV